MRHRWSRASRCLSQIARTLVEFVSRRLEQKKQAGGGDFALIVVAVNLQDNIQPLGSRGPGS